MYVSIYLSIYLLIYLLHVPIIYICIYVYLSISYNYKGRPKWIPLYDRRTLIDGRSHKSTWSSIFDDAVDGSTVDNAIDQETFITRIQALAYRPCLGTYIFLY